MTATDVPTDIPNRVSSSALPESESSMTAPTTKAKLLITVTALMVFGFVMMLRKALYVPCAILACVWAAHLVYFLCFVKTLRKESETTES